MTNNRCKVLGYCVDLLKFNEAIDFALEKVKKNEFLHIVTINPEIIALADKNSELKEIIESSELVIPESSGIRLALKLKGIKQEQIAGIDYAKCLIDKCTSLNYKVSLIGAKKHIVEKAKENLQKEFPNLNVVYWHDGYFEKDEEIIDEIRKNNPDIILCALGAPKQELFINKCKSIVKKGVYIGIGGSFDVWAGEVQRAPLIFQKLCLEWLYRTVKQPSRLKRIYKTLPMFFFRAIMDCRKR